MLKMIDLIENVNKEYIPMLKMVNIANFTKCVSIFSGLKMNEISDTQIKDYLLTWAKNKYHFFKMLGNNIRKDIDFSYLRPQEETSEEYCALAKEYPHFGPWLNQLKVFQKNEIEQDDYFNNNLSLIEEYFANEIKKGMTVTHFAKRCLLFPDEVVTRIAAIYENSNINATYTISIDPVDMMTASENPYNWSSCYRLETYNCDSHADGCMAAMLDSVSLIGYIWTSSGKLKLYNTYELKDVRYKKIRNWICLSPNMTTAYFCKPYPTKYEWSTEFRNQIKDITKKVVADYLGRENKWDVLKERCVRINRYGYDEFSDNLLVIDGSEKEDINVYNEKIKCACGCDFLLPGSQDYGENYLGEGFSCNGWQEAHWCSLKEDYCTGGDETYEGCEGCSYWEDEHPVCGLTSWDECIGRTCDHDVVQGVCQYHSEHCRGCRLAERYANEEEEEEEEY